MLITFLGLLAFSAVVTVVVVGLDALIMRAFNIK